jgi:hypothetical protein
LSSALHETEIQNVRVRWYENTFCEVICYRGSSKFWWEKGTKISRGRFPSQFLHWRIGHIPGCYQQIVILMEQSGQKRVPLTINA